MEDMIMIDEMKREGTGKEKGRYNIYDIAIDIIDDISDIV